MKQFYLFLGILLLSTTAYPQFYQYTARKSGYWNDASVWTISVLPAGSTMHKAVIPSPYIVDLDNGVNGFGLGNIEIIVEGALRLSNNTNIGLSSLSSVELRNAGRIIGSNPTQIIRIGGVEKYNGLKDGIETGPSLASAISDVSPNGFFAFAVLPTEITNFNVSAAGNSNMIHWTTRSETGNSFFQVERSYEASTWSIIGKVAATNANSLRAFYSFEDRSPQKTTVYYRLKQVDLDGTFKYSVVKKLSSTGKKMSIKMMNDLLTVDLGQSTENNAIITVVNSAGMMIATRRLGAGSTQIHQLQIRQQGILFVQVTDGMQLKESASFLR